jgi:hypothetical protein
MFLENAGNISHFSNAYHPHAQVSIIIFSYINQTRAVYSAFIQSYRQTAQNLHVTVQCSVRINLLALLLFLH